VVIGPAEDGGYYFIKRNNPLIFQNKNWGTDTVFKAMKDLKGHQISL
jgi:glycosyltransferase A (GT-A) superfamily protein (DUF2064 family)